MTDFRLRPRTLTTRLVITSVVLVAAVGVLVGLIGTLAMRGYLTDQLDGQVHDFMRGTQRALGIGDGGDRDLHPERPPTQTPGILIGFVPGSGAATPQGTIADSRPGGTGATAVGADTLRRLARLPADERAHSAKVDGVGYRVQTSLTATGTLIVGLPATQVEATTDRMLLWLGLLTVLGVAIAAILGDLLVRRQLRPLRAVALTARDVTTQDLSTGEVETGTRVSDELTDPATEVGQVGSALNTLLDHVDAALADRHRSEQQVRQFVADASHELRTPLSTIHGYAELARRTPDDAQALSSALGRVESAAELMSGLVEDLLLLARLDAGRPLAADEVDLTRLLLEAVADSRVLAPEHHCRLELPDEPIVITADGARLQQVFTNLLSNARHHTPAGTTVRVAARLDPAADQVVVEVLDDGPGIPAGLLPDVFDRFTRGDSSRTRASGGAGLGLSLVRAIVEAHHGTVAVDSEPGSTRFTVRLPLRRS